MSDTKNHVIVKPEFNEFVQAVDEYTSQLPLVTRESIRQVLYCEYEEKYQEMEKLCDDILEKNPGNAEALALLGRAQMSQRKYTEAEQTLRGLLEKEPERNYERIEHGIALHALGRYHEALRELQKADPEADYHPFYYTILGNCYQNTGNRQKARDSFRAEVTRWEKTGEMASQEILDGCFNNLIYLDAALYHAELSADLNSYESFLEKAEMTPEMKEVKESTMIGYLKAGEVESLEVEETTLKADLADGKKVYVTEVVADNVQIIFKVLLTEARTALITGFTITTGLLLGYSAMSGTVGGGGLGDIAVRYGYYRWQTDIMLITVALLVILFQIFQMIGMKIASALDHRK